MKFWLPNSFYNLSTMNTFDVRLDGRVRTSNEYGALKRRGEQSMKVLSMLLLISLLSLFAAESSAQKAPGRAAKVQPQGQITPGEFDIGLLHYTLPPPEVAPTPLPRMWRSNAGERWKDIEKERGNYGTFGNLDGWISLSKSLGVSLIYTFNTVPSWASGRPNSGQGNDLAYTPIDVKVSAPCQAPLAGVNTTDCFFKEFVTKLMQHVCQTPKPSASSTCSIQYWEMWNELNASNFYNTTATPVSYEQLAIMSNDAATIIRQYCGNCTIIGGSVAGAGDGGHGPSPPNVSGQFHLALKQYLDAWHSIPNASLPDAISFHAYPSRTNVSPPPFPETNVSTGDSRCTAANVPNQSCRTAIKDMPSLLRATLPSWTAGLPIYDTEGSWNGNSTLVGENQAATDELRQAWVARWMLMLAPTEVKVNLWYQWDNQCFGTMFGTNKPCNGEPPIPVGFTPVQKTWVQIASWLAGATFDAPGCNNVGKVWSCGITKSGIHQTIKWVQDKSVAATADVTNLTVVDVTGKAQAHTGAATVNLGIRPILITPR
jgi:hypothetical protein